MSISVTQRRNFHRVASEQAQIVSHIYFLSFPGDRLSFTVLQHLTTKELKKLELGFFV